MNNIDKEYVQQWELDEDKQVSYNTLINNT